MNKQGLKYNKGDVIYNTVQCFDEDVDRDDEGNPLPSTDDLDLPIGKYVVIRYDKYDDMVQIEYPKDTFDWYGGHRFKLISRNVIAYRARNKPNVED